VPIDDDGVIGDLGVGLSWTKVHVPAAELPEPDGVTISAARRRRLVRWPIGTGFPSSRRPVRPARYGEHIKPLSSSTRMPRVRAQWETRECDHLVSSATSPGLGWLIVA
jgi:hypothetical protein